MFKAPSTSVGDARNNHQEAFGMDTPSRLDSGLIESPFEILPGEIRQVRLQLDPSWAAEGYPFYGWISSDGDFQVVDAAVGKMKVDVREVPAGVDPYEAEWTAAMRRIPTGEDLVLFVKNFGEQAARYRGRWR